MEGECKPNPRPLLHLIARRSRNRSVMHFAVKIPALLGILAYPFAGYAGSKVKNLMDACRA